MNQYREEFEERRKKVTGLLEETAALLSSQNNAEDAAAMLELKKNIENGLFGIVLIGEFSAGKSTFLNALMGKRILPSFTGETTATVNFLRHTSQAPNGERGIVYYHDGTQKRLETLDRQTLEKVVSTHGEKVAETIDKVDLFLDNKFLEDGVMLVDSPGLNGVAANHAEITYRQIKESHASIFMFRANQPGTRTEFEALRYLKEQCNNIFVVMNRIDDINTSDDSVENVVETLKRSYSDQFKGERMPEIYPISARMALAARDENEPDPHRLKKDEARRRDLEEMSRLSAFEERLEKYLTQGERSREQLISPVKKVQAVLKEQQDLLERSIEVLSQEQGADELNEQKAALEEAIAKLNGDRSAASKTLRAKFDKVVRDAADKVDQRCEAIKAEIESELKGLGTPDALSEYASDLSGMIDKRCIRLVQKFDESLREDFMMIVDEESDDQLNDLDEALSKATGAEFKLSGNNFSLTVEEVGRRMEEDKAEQDRLYREKQQLEEELNRLERRSIAARRKEREIENIRRELREAQERRRNLEDNFTPPPVQVTLQQKVDYEWRGGLFGKIITPLIGKREIVREEVQRDSSARDEAIRLQNEKLSSIDGEIERLRGEFQGAQGSDADSETLNYDIGKTKLKLLERQKQYEESVLKFQTTLRAEAERAGKKMRKQIMSFVEERLDESRTEIGKYLKKTKEGSLKAIEGLFFTRINGELEHQREKLDKLLALSQENAAERDRKLQAAREALELGRQLTGRSIELEVEIDESMNDKIAEA